MGNTKFKKILAGLQGTLIMVWDKLTVIVYSDLGAETDSWLIQLMALKKEGNIVHMWERPMILDKLS